MDLGNYSTNQRSKFNEFKTNNSNFYFFALLIETTSISFASYDRMITLNSSLMMNFMGMEYMILMIGMVNGQMWQHGMNRKIFKIINKFFL